MAQLRGSNGKFVGSGRGRGARGTTKRGELGNVLRSAREINAGRASAGKATLSNARLLKIAQRVQKGVRKADARELRGLKKGDLKLTKDDIGNRGARSFGFHVGSRSRRIRLPSYGSGLRGSN